MHEAQLHDDNCFITLTYRDEHLPAYGSLVKADFQKFMKRLRKRSRQKIRYFQCGEYGENFSRPHYHACLFGFDFADKILFSEAGGQALFVSPLLADLWPFGFSTIGAVTFESAAYVARYVTKKVTGDAATDHYLVVDQDSGAIAEDVNGDFVTRVPEYVCMSRRPGIAADWYAKYERDVFPTDEVISRGMPMRPARYYDKLFEANHGEEEMNKIKRARVKKMKRFAHNNTDERLVVREKVSERRLSDVKRKYESGDI